MKADYRVASTLAGLALFVATLWLADGARRSLPGAAASRPATTIAGLALMLGMEAPDPRQPASDFTLPTLDGAPVRLADLEGRVVLLNFWATWCPPCRAEMPAMERVYRELAPRGFVIVAVNYREGPDVARPFVKELGLTFPIALDEQGKVSEGLYAIVGLPTSYLVDRQGRVVARKVGYVEWEGAAARALLETLLDEPAAPS